jgi:release factor glutamine methyltransferase
MGFPMPRNHVAKMLTVLAKSIGRESANQELKWMTQALQPVPGSGAVIRLESMLLRRVRGEPLQYILGGYLFS